MSNLKALVLGGSGGVGQSVLKALAHSPNYSNVTVLLRKEMHLPASDENANINYEKFEQKIIDFEKISEYSHLFQGYDVVFYAIGVSSAAVNEAEYRHVVLDYALAIGKVIKEAGINEIHWITASGASKNSWFLFGRIKAQVEEELSKMGFKRAVFYRPAGVLTAGASRQLSATSIRIMSFLDPCRFRTVEADALGEAMVVNSLRESDKKVEILENSDINKLGKNRKK